MPLTIDIDQRGELRAILVGPTGATHSILIGDGDRGISRLRQLCRLQAQAERLAQEARKIGSEFSPTQALVEHWDNHALFPRDNCPFCRGERKSKPSNVVELKRAIPIGDGSVTVRRIERKPKPKPKPGIHIDLEDLLP